MVRTHPRSTRPATLFPDTTLFRSARGVDANSVDGIPTLARELQDRHFDRVFNVPHGGDGESGVLQGLLESLRVPYTGSGVLGSALSLDKRSEEHTSELQSLMRISYAVFCLKKNTQHYLSLIH